MATATSLPDKLEQGSVKSKRSVQRERVLQAFHAELQMMDQEDELKRMKREHEFARKQEEATSRLRKLTKQFNERMAELKGNRADIEYSETHSVKLDLPEEKREDSIQRYLQSQGSVAQQSPQQPRSDVTPVYESNGLQKVAESLAEVARSMAIQSAGSQQVAVTSQLPHIDLPVFSGDPLQYPLWKNAFVSLVDRNPVNHPTKLHYLNNSVAGAPKRLVQHYLLLGTEDAYHKACGALAEQYGSQSVVSAAFTKYEGSSKCTNVCSLPDQDGKEHCMIVPVWVRHASNPGNEILQYAILDDQSNVGFVSKALCEKMCVDGTDTNLQLTTMHESTRIKTSRICRLEVLDFKKEHVVTLPACYQRDDVPARGSQIPKGDVMRRWAHLSPIADDLMPYNPAIEVGLLIGNDCPRAIRPRDIICGGEDEPYAQRSILGWDVVGTVCMSANQEIFCKKTCVKDDYPRFAYANRAREVFSSERVLNVLEKDIIEMNQKGKPYSIDEMKFMSMLEKGVRKREDGHYEMPLPLKSKERSRPYNKPLAIKRWNQLTARFRKNQKFQEDYTEFMKGVVADHAERVPPDRLKATDSVRTSERSRY